MKSGETPVDDTSASGKHPLPKGTELYAEWVERMQRGRARHAAISRNLYTWSNYKNWAEKVRGTWDAELETPKKK